MGKKLVEVVHDDNSSLDSKIAGLEGVHNSKDMWHKIKNGLRPMIESLIAKHEELQTLNSETPAQDWGSARSSSDCSEPLLLGL
jgi:hypothetical protein